MNTYYAVLKLRLQTGLQYRTAAWAGVATQFFWGLIYIMLFQAFYSGAAGKQPISLEQLTTYVWLQQAFLAFIMLWFRDNELFDLITSGNIAYELCRPADLYSFWYAKLLAQRLSAALLRFAPILLIAFWLPTPYGLSLPPGPWQGGLFVLALLIGLLLLVAISMFIYISVFITMSPIGSLLIFAITGEFLSGMIVPLPLMPDWLQRILYVLPFRLTVDFPFRVYSGHIPTQEALWGIVQQIAWLLVLIWLGKKTMRSVLRRVVVQGG
ncbi:ABC transporter permease [Ectobacillus ponti]|uniref:ABC transporter permease n=1 Tax=Ectobacillus ponti TaxID=2961894 RepID=A0AA41X5P2_9BACI|nr:ABC transporter permease [Ectobacillus ponti]MCP8967114.1 ABC transporter permease [Ectobacillus ponti]